MMLVPSDIHGAVRHTGGAALINKGLRPKTLEEIAEVFYD
jgi:hypothetical protein